MSAITRSQPDPGIVLCKALLNVREALDLKQTELGDIIGLNRSSVSRLQTLDPQSKTGELALLLVRVYRSLFAMVGGDAEAMRHWLRTANTHLGGEPLQLMGSVQGLIHVVEYLDAVRGRV
jgi:hypothetical protein